MMAKDYLRIISDVIHTSIVATVDDEGLPKTAAIDMMMSDESGLYFLTARGKSFYERLTKRGYLALTALQGEDTMHSVAVSLRGRVRELGPALLPKDLTDKPLDSLVATVMQGRPGSAMPGWSRFINEDEARWIVRELVRGFPELPVAER